MHNGAIRNHRELDGLVLYLKQYRLPFKWMVQDIYPGRSLDANAYLWGVVYKRISDFTGHTTKEVHEGYLELFNIEYSPVPNSKTNEWALRVKRTSEMNTVELIDYALMVRADAQLDMGITIELPNEVFINELNFSHEPLVD